MSLRTLLPCLLAMLVVLPACVAGPGNGPGDGEGAVPPVAADADPSGAAPPPPSPSPSASPSRDCSDPLDCWERSVPIGAFDAEVVPEASGLVASLRNPGLYYLLDDGPGTTQVWVLRPEAGLVGATTVVGLQGRDTEGLAVGACGPGDPVTCVYVGDIGDNRRTREQVRVHRFVEPDLAVGVPAEVGADSVALRYPDGAHNAEALLVDAAGVPYIVTKARFDSDTGVTGPTGLYRAPGYADGTMEWLGDLTLPPTRRTLAAGVVGNVVTGGDSRAGHVLLRTYDAVLSFRSPDPAAPLAGLPTWPVFELPSPVLRQPEAVAFASDGCGYAMVSEGDGDLWVAACRP